MFESTERKLPEKCYSLDVHSKDGGWARGRSSHASEDVEQCCLAGPIVAQYGCDLPLINIQAETFWKKKNKK